MAQGAGQQAAPNTDANSFWSQPLAAQMLSVARGGHKAASCQDHCRQPCAPDLMDQHQRKDTR